ncbi:energy-coupling factor ABC transporter ATP-binding protein [Paenibacillus glucanolyticus]|jgi:energy-coupling factor transport system ATP-binding protein|uniref:ATP-binding cassette domain-containing protein n=1 Tax=Paenibacillus TaxID=44249 RepID=UPI0003E1F7B0|nr:MULTISPECIES: ATP-binding cassette domain-containing protein [Paenibacillus]ANA80528.1 energy-coupling factor transporter ATPase [Paenibacillus glucanolyticus]AVV55401.1 energy-coupling factor ABC transporter ATP-binding protein [Paenibacillus glucanolyticus]ETT31028.1 ABC transporter-like protein [Paenibacillus sp. FSL R5-808]MPY15715.1 ATP-binding cassette domain-containing protein [Paenibacillus glucanolyticus]
MGTIDKSKHAVLLEHVYYGQGCTNVLKDVSLAIPHGQWVCIAGRNGAGKSTLIRLLNGLLLMSRGRILIDGLEQSGRTLGDIRRHIGMVFANPDDQFVGLTVEDDIAFGLENLCLSREEMQHRIQTYAERLDIVHLLNRHPATLSGGQKQRSAIAAVLAMEPSILVLDEAASMLDEKAKNELLDSMRAMHADGRYTLISITHDVEEMAEADRLIVLDGGMVTADGSPRELLLREDLLQRCRLKAPFALQLCRELKERGIDIGELVREKEVQEALWLYHSKRYLTATGTGG